MRCPLVADPSRDLRFTLAAATTTTVVSPFDLMIVTLAFSNWSFFQFQYTRQRGRLAEPNRTTTHLSSRPFPFLGFLLRNLLKSQLLNLAAFASQTRRCMRLHQCNLRRTRRGRRRPCLLLTPTGVPSHRQVALRESTTRDASRCLLAPTMTLHFLVDCRR